MDDIVTCWSRRKHGPHPWSRVLDNQPVQCPGYDPAGPKTVGETPTITSVRTTKR